MSLSPVAQADRNSRSRAWIMAMGAVMLVAICGFGAFGGVDIGEAPSRAAAWALLILLWLANLATGGGIMVRGEVRRLMNDEVSVYNRRRAIEFGFWTAMLLAIAAYFASFFWPMTLRAGLAGLSELAIATALLRYAWLELH